MNFINDLYIMLLTTKMFKVLMSISADSSMGLNTVHRIQYYRYCTFSLTSMLPLFFICIILSATSIPKPYSQAILSVKIMFVVKNKLNHLPVVQCT